MRRLGPGRGMMQGWNSGGCGGVGLSRAGGAGCRRAEAGNGLEEQCRVCTAFQGWWLSQGISTFL